MKEPVYFIPKSNNDTDETLSNKLNEVIKQNDLLHFITEKDYVAIKTHFGEQKDLGYARPIYFKKLQELLKNKQAQAFLTETSTLYKGDRSNAIDHIALAQRHGFGYEKTGLPIIMLDGLYGNEEIEVDIKGKIYSSVKVAQLLERCQGLIVVSHFTGHMLSGFGAALKNLGMGCTTRKAKLIQHSTVKPKVKKRPCTKCALCIEWCPADAITMQEDSAVINKEICIGCGECLAVCRFDAIAYNWGASHEDLQKKVVEHAMGVINAIKGNALYINFLINISKDCDCMGPYNQVADDIGILISRDPVAIDAASLYLVEKESGKTLSDLAHNIPYNFQLDYAKELQFGNLEFEIIQK